MKKIVLSLITVAGMLLAASPAFATEVDCSTGRNLTSYNVGKAVGANAVNSAWNSTSRSPDRYEAFRRVIRQTFRTAIGNIPADASEFVLCRAKGAAAGARHQLGVIQGQVATVCLVDGQLWGAISGDLYCALAFAFGSVAPFDLEPIAPSTVCGTNFVAGCEGAFEDYAYLTCDDFTDAPLVGEACYPTEFRSWVDGMCTYTTAP
jgi:hypothetical protein